MKNAIGIFGGTFDPVHNGHLRIALDALETLDLAEVRLIPLARAVHREQPETPAAIRLEMLQAAVMSRSLFVVDDRELNRDGPSYTIDTLNSLHDEFPDQDLCLLLGGDAFNSFLTWRDPEGILSMANLAILGRPGHERAPEPAIKQLLERHEVAQLSTGRTGQIVNCPVTQLDIAASDIRRRISAGLSVDFLVPDQVLTLIKAYGLYSHETTAQGRQNEPVGL